MCQCKEDILYCMRHMFAHLREGIPGEHHEIVIDDHKIELKNLLLKEAADLQENLALLVSQCSNLTQLIYSKFRNSVRLLNDRRVYLLSLISSGNFNDIKANIKKSSDISFNFNSTQILQKVLDEHFVKNNLKLPEIEKKQQIINKLEEDNKIFISEIQKMKEIIDLNESKSKNYEQEKAFISEIQKLKEIIDINESKYKINEEELKGKINSLENQSRFYKEEYENKKEIIIQDLENEMKGKIEASLNEIEKSKKRNFELENGIKRLKNSNENSYNKGITDEKMINSLKKENEMNKNIIKELENNNNSLRSSKTNLENRLEQAEKSNCQKQRTISELQQKQTREQSRIEEENKRCRDIDIKNLTSEKVQFIHDLAARAKSGNASRKDMCSYIKKTVKKREGGKWNIIIGDEMAYHISNNRHIFFKLGQDTILLFSHS